MNIYNINQIDPDDSGSIKIIRQSRSSDIKKYYLSGAIITLVFIFINFIITINLISLQSGSSLLINVAGRQRMLSQRIVLVSKLIYDDINDENYNLLSEHQKQLGDLIREIEGKNSELQSGSIGGKYYIYQSQKIIDMYTKQPFDLNRKLNSYIQSATIFKDFAPRRKISAISLDFYMSHLVNSSSEILSIFDSIVSQYDSEYSQKISDIKNTIFLIVIKFCFLRVNPQIKNVILYKRNKYQNIFTNLTKIY